VTWAPNTRGFLLGWLLGVCCWLPAPQTRAQPVEPVAEATRLFDEADVLMRDKQYAPACERYARSHALDPQLGTLLHLADCEELLGRTASAQRDFLAAAQLAAARRASGKPDPREAVALRRAEQLKPQLAYLRLIPPAQAIAALQVEQDGVVVPSEAVGAALPLDPGPHSIRLSAPGHQPWSHTLTVAPATRHELPLPPLSPLPDSGAAAHGGQQPAQESAARAPAPGSVSPQRVVAYVVGGAALVGLGAAAILGTRADHFRAQRDALCPGERCVLGPQDAARAYELDDKARGFAAAFNWTGALSLAGLSAAVVLYVTGGERSPASPTVRVGWGSVAVHGQL
jgi:hypothetical protein